MFGYEIFFLILLYQLGDVKTDVKDFLVSLFTNLITAGFSFV